MSDPRLSFVGSLAGITQDQMLGELGGTVLRLNLADSASKSFAGQILFTQLATLLVRLFDRVELVGDEGVTVHSEVPGMAGEFLPSLRNLLTTLRPLTPRPETGRVIEVLVGARAEPGQINLGSTGWAASVSRIRACGVAESDNPLGALAAGILGAAEVFKFAFEGRLQGSFSADEYELSLLTYANAEGPNIDLPQRISLDLTLFGCGSVGMGLLSALVALPQVTGRLRLVDNGRFDERNPYKYSLLDWESARQKPFKAVWGQQRVQSLVAGRVTAAAFVGTAEQYVASLPWDYQIPLAAAAVDTFEARMEIQETLPRRVVNAGVDGTSVEVSLHGFGRGACLACLAMQQDLESWDAGAIAAKVGLSPQRAFDLIRGNTPMIQEDINAIRSAGVGSVEVAANLDSYLGQPLLSLWNRIGYAEAAVGGAGQRINVSTAFVSAFAGLLLLVEVVKHQVEALEPYRLSNSYRQQLLGVPANDVMVYQRDSTGGCLCHSSYRASIYEEKYGHL